MKTAPVVVLIAILESIVGRPIIYLEYLAVVLQTTGAVPAA
jgi:hypothetical protein